MNTQSRNNVDLRHVAQLIAPIPIAMLTQVEAGGGLAGRPMSVLEIDADGAFWFFVDGRTTKAEHLWTANLGFSDAARGVWVSLSGRGEIVDDRARFDRLWASTTRHWFAEGPDDPSLVLLKFVPDAADYWDAAQRRMVRAVGGFFPAAARNAAVPRAPGPMPGLSLPARSNGG